MIFVSFLSMIYNQTWALGANRAPGANQAILVAWARPGAFFLKGADSKEPTTAVVGSFDVGSFERSLRR